VSSSHNRPPRSTAGHCETAFCAIFARIHAAANKASPLAKCEFATIRERLIKIGARVIEHVARIRVQLPTGCPDAALFRSVALNFMPSGP
jgi:hypothetical protein